MFKENMLRLYIFILLQFCMFVSCIKHNFYTFVHTPLYYTTEDHVSRLATFFFPFSVPNVSAFSFQMSFLPIKHNRSFEPSLILFPINYLNASVLPHDKVLSQVSQSQNFNTNASNKCHYIVVSYV